jgi:general stress protein YciG
MPDERKGQGEGSLRGFAGMEQEKQREIARKGGPMYPTRSAALPRTVRWPPRLGARGGEQ